MKCDNIMKQYKNISFNYITEKEIKRHNPNWAQIP